MKRQPLIRAYIVVFFSVIVSTCAQGGEHLERNQITSFFPEYSVSFLLIFFIILGSGFPKSEID